MSTVHDHERLIELAIAELRNQGAQKIFASHLPNYSQPNKIGNFIPDVTAFIGTSFVIVEAETQDGLSHQDTEPQWRAFQKYAVAHGGKFVAVVNNEDKLEASLLMKKISAGTESQVRTF